MVFSKYGRNPRQVPRASRICEGMSPITTDRVSPDFGLALADVDQGGFLSVKSWPTPKIRQTHNLASTATDGLSDIAQSPIADQLHTASVPRYANRNRGVKIAAPGEAVSIF